MAKPTDEWFGQAFGKAWKDKAEEIGRFNLAIFGKTGVGKSTLVNAIFGADIAATGIGEPVTRTEHLYLHQSGTLGVLDTRGLEVGRDNAKLLAELTGYLEGMRRRPLTEQIHVAWYCVRAGDRRFEPTEADFIRALADLGLPVILVLTQVARGAGSGGRSRVHPDTEELAASIAALDLPIVDGLIHYTMAKDDEFAGQTAYGLQEVLDATFRGAPEGVAHAIVSAQQIDFVRKRERAEVAIKAATGTATTVGATPIPFSDAALLVPIQLGMMASIAVTYGIAIDRSTAASIAATAAATTAGRTVVTSLIKFVPGAGTAVATPISATVAGTFTYAMGQAWVRVCERMARGELRAVGGALDSDAVRRVFMEEFKAQASRRKLPDVSTRWERIARETVGEDYAARYAERFRAMAERGDDIHGEAAFVADLLPAPARVLDAGCGTGRVAVRLAALGYDVVGVDVDAAMLDVARAEAPGLDWRLGDLASFDLGEQFDLVLVAGNTIPLLEPGTLLDACERLGHHLTPGGVIVCGFGLDAAHLPGDCPPTALVDIDAAFGVLGLDAVARYGTWEGHAFDPAAGYAVTLYAEPRR